mmetsp:Transcript_22699/g.26176  ORF Transcript_22699/g.26176 Transcript_22699/m.26176 type:complete len:247 (+) Transcript_22699:132-872(+)
MENRDNHADRITSDIIEDCNISSEDDFDKRRRSRRLELNRRSARDRRRRKKVLMHQLKQVEKDLIYEQNQLKAISKTLKQKLAIFSSQVNSHNASDLHDCHMMRASSGQELVQRNSQNEYRDAILSGQSLSTISNRQRRQIHERFLEPNDALRLAKSALLTRDSVSLTTMIKSSVRSPPYLWPIDNVERNVQLPISEQEKDIMADTLFVNNIRAHNEQQLQEEYISRLPRQTSQGSRRYFSVNPSM